MSLLKILSSKEEKKFEPQFEDLKIHQIWDVKLDRF